MKTLISRAGGILFLLVLLVVSIILLIFTVGYLIVKTALGKWEESPVRLLPGEHVLMKNVNGVEDGEYWMEESYYGEH